ncbi:MAG TPA: CBS domain-containing protein [Gemmatimonadales bacterium]|nr:CBS domain-containing protein [Gemmatimonadales bacterium]
MPTVRDLLLHKGGELASIAPTASALAAAQQMNDRRIGSLLVLEGDTLAGIFTERDILRRVVAAGRDPAATPVREVMTSPVLTCVPETSLDECAAIMTTHRIRHLPVAGGQGLQGMVSIGDVLAFQVREHEATIQYMNSYMFDVR